MAFAVLGAAIGVPLFYFLLTISANALQAILMALFVIPAVMLVVEGLREGKVARDKVVAMLVIFVFNVLFWMFFEQAGSSFNFLAQNIVNRDLWGWEFPVGWFQSVNSIAIITLAPIMAWIWVKMGSKNPSIPRKFGLGLIFNGLSKLDKSRTWSYIVSAMCAPALNTLFFMGYIVLAFYNCDYVQNLVSVKGAANPLMFVVLLVGVQGVAEFLVSGILGGIVARAVHKFLK